jgi:DNA-directed RNA polymerase subunit RPC12/RpoP
MVAHIQSVHGIKMPYLCLFCDSKFNEKFNLQKISKSSWSKNLPNQCLLCDSKFREKKYDKTHINGS